MANLVVLLESEESKFWTHFSVFKVLLHAKLVEVELGLG